MSCELPAGHERRVRGSPLPAQPGGRRWLGRLLPGTTYLSVLTLGEIRRGVEQLWRHDWDQAQRREVWLARLEGDYGDRVLPVTAGRHRPGVRPPDGA